MQSGQNHAKLNSLFCGLFFLLLFENRTILRFKLLLSSHQRTPCSSNPCLWNPDVI